MRRRIRRRDFLNGVAIATGTALSPAALRRAFADSLEPEAMPDYYPPALTGMRGDHDDIYKTPHALRDQNFWQTAGTPNDTGESYDLVIVGGGISGLAAARFYRQATGPGTRILILENHDDFGGHAKRNEFHQTGRMLLGYGGTFSIESPWPYSPVARQVIDELGIDVASYRKAVDRKLYPSLGLSPAVFFDKETFGRDVLVTEPRPDSYNEPSKKQTTEERWTIFLSNAPLAEQAKKDLRRLYSEHKDYMPGLSSDEKKARLARMSYAKYLTDVAQCHEDVVKYLQARPYSLFGLGIDAVSAQDAWGLEFPGFAGLKLDPAPGPGQNRDAIRSEEAERYFYHFPDGNSSIARMLVRGLIPDAVPATNATDIVMARTNFAALDRKSNNTRIRLNSTVVKVAHAAKRLTQRASILHICAVDSCRVCGRRIACWLAGM